MLGLIPPVAGQRVELLEEIDGQHCAIWREGSAIVSDDGWLTSDAETLAKLSRVLIDESVEAVLVYPSRLASSEPVLTDLVVNDTLRPPHELREAAKLAGIRTVATVYDGAEGMDEDRALSMLAVNGAMGSTVPVDRLRCWLTYRGLPIQCALIERAKETIDAIKPVLPNPFAATVGDRAATAALAQAIVSARGGKRSRAARGTVEAHKPVRERGNALRLPGV